MSPAALLPDCPGLAVPAEVLRHVVQVESSFNPYAIGVVGGRLVRQPRHLDEAVATARSLERQGRNFSLGLAQVNRHNLKPQGLHSYASAFQACPNLLAGARILADCHRRWNGDWGKSFSCYYSGNAVTGFRHGYVQKVFASMGRAAPPQPRSRAIDAAPRTPRGNASRAAARVRDATRPDAARPPDLAFVF